MQITQTTALSTLPTGVKDLDPRQEALATARQFEQIFLREMLKGMRKSASIAGGESMFGDGPGSGTYEDWFDGHMATHLSAGRGIGLASVMMADWARHGHIPAEEPDGQQTGGQQTDDQQTDDQQTSVQPRGERRSARRSRWCGRSLVSGYSPPRCSPGPRRPDRTSWSGWPLWPTGTASPGCWNVGPRRRRWPRCASPRR